MERIRESVSISFSLPSLSLTVTPCINPLATIIFTSCVSKRTVPPKEIISSRIFFTTPFSLSVPIWGFALYRISSGAPWDTNSSNTKRQRLSFIPVVSLPSEKVPAPPSPYWIFEVSSRTLVLQNRFTSAVRLSTSLPLSITVGQCPLRARIRAANMPAGPKPATTGGRVLFRFDKGILYEYFSHLLTLDVLREARILSSSPSTVTSAV